MKAKYILFLLLFFIVSATTCNKTEEFVPTQRPDSFYVSMLVNGENTAYSSLSYDNGRGIAAFITNEPTTLISSVGPLVINDISVSTAWSFTIEDFIGPGTYEATFSDGLFKGVRDFYFIQPSNLERVGFNPDLYTNGEVFGEIVVEEINNLDRIKGVYSFDVSNLQDTVLSRQQVSGSFDLFMAN